MKSKILISLTIPFLKSQEKFSTFKIALRHENSHALVNAAFRIEVDANYKVVSQPTLVFGGVLEKAARASQTEKALLNQVITDDSTFKNALSVLAKVSGWETFYIHVL
jgi:xanthine dehydrogenase iron-sulfur cluster and FAD-binding subunit A